MNRRQIATTSAPVNAESSPKPKKLSSQLEGAFALAERGLPVFPIDRHAKKPAHKGWQDAATDDPITLAEWFADNEGYDVGVFTGRDLIAVDCDVKTVDGTANFLAGAPDGKAPETLTIATPSGGRHFIFRGSVVKNSVSKLARGVDIRSKGGLIASLGSSRADGTTYSIANDAPIADAPAWLVEWISQTYAKAEPKTTAPVELDTAAAIHAAISYLGSEAPPAVSGEGGNPTTYQVACRVRDLGVGEDKCGDLMLGHWNDRNPPPWPEDELRSIVSHAYQYAENSPGSASAAAEFEVLGDDVEPEAAANDNRRAKTLARSTLDLAALAGAPIPERNWHVEGWIPGSNVTLLYGDGGTGKSLLAMQLAVATATGRQWLGVPVKQGRVVYLTAEDDGTELHRRIAAIASREDIPLRDLAGDLRAISLVSEDPALVIAGERDRLKSTPLWRELVAAIGEFKPGLIVLDTLADVFAGNENVRAHARGFIAMLRAVAIEHSVAVVVLAHPSRAGLDTSGWSSGAGSSGSTAWHNSVRSRLVLSRDAKDPDLRTLTGVKAQYDRVGSAIQLRYANGVFEGSAAATAAGGEAETREVERVFLDLLDNYAAEGRRVSSLKGPTYAPARFAEDERSGAFGSAQLADAMNRLFAADLIREVETGSPSRRRHHLARVEPFIDTAEAA